MAAALTGLFTGSIALRESTAFVGTWKWTWSDGCRRVIGADGKYQDWWPGQPGALGRTMLDHGSWTADGRRIVLDNGVGEAVYELRDGHLVPVELDAEWRGGPWGRLVVEGSYWVRTGDWRPP